MILTESELFGLFFVIMGVVVVVFLVPLLKKMLTNQQRRELLESVGVAVAAAQQLFPECEGSQRKEYALQILEEQGFEVDTPDIINAMEASVLYLHSVVNKEMIPS